MPEVEGVSKTSFRNWLFPQGYDWAKGSYKAAGEDREIATIREYVLGNIADVRLSAHDANPAISMVQAFERAATAIDLKLAQMEAVADKAAKGYYTNTDRASMQKQLQELAKQINNIAGNTEYDGNKLFTTEGRVIVRSIGNGRSIRLFAKDLSFPAENVDLTKDAKVALRAIKHARKETSEYIDYLKSQGSLLRNAMATIEQKVASATGIESSDFETQTMQQFIKNLSGRISNDTGAATDVQANITSDEALQLLKD